MHRALLICNSTYPGDPAQLPTLKGPQVDGMLLWRALTDPLAGLFEDSRVRVLHERSHDEVLQEAERFCDSARAGDTLLIYFTGHGLVAGQSLYLCARDTVSKSIRSTGISTDEVSKMVDGSTADAVVIILDCCFSGGFKGIVAPNLGGRGRYVITATTSYDLARDAAEEGAPSPFTGALVEGLLVGAAARRDGVVDLEALMLDLQDRLPEDAPRPERDFDGSGRVAIARRSETNDMPIEKPVAVRAATMIDDPSRSSAALAIFSTPRRRGDLTIADRSEWRLVLILGLATTALGGWSFLDIKAAAGSFSDSPVLEELSTASAAASGALMVLLSLLEALRIRWNGVSRMGRRQAVEFLGSKRPWAYRLILFLIIAGALFAAASPLAARGFATNQWTACLACLALFVFIAGARFAGWGDNVLVAAGSLIVIGNFVPIWYEGDGFRSGVQSPLGLLWVAIGLGLLGAWYWRYPKPLLAALGAALVLSLLGGIGEVAFRPQPHWTLTVIGCVFLLLTTLAGATRPLPIQGARVAGTGT